MSKTEVPNGLCNMQERGAKRAFRTDEGICNKRLAEVYSVELTGAPTYNIKIIVCWAKDTLAMAQKRNRKQRRLDFQR